jgi:hypothetical protein
MGNFQKNIPPGLKPGSVFYCICSHSLLHARTGPNRRSFDCAGRVCATGYAPGDLGHPRLFHPALAELGRGTPVLGWATRLEWLAPRRRSPDTNQRYPDEPDGSRAPGGMGEVARAKIPKRDPGIRLVVGYYFIWCQFHHHWCKSIISPCGSYLCGCTVRKAVLHYDQTG